MELLKFLLIFAALSVVLVVSHARATPPMIKLVTDLLQNDGGESESLLTFLNKKYVAESELEGPPLRKYKTYGAAKNDGGESESPLTFLNKKYVAESELEGPPLRKYKTYGAAKNDVGESENPLPILHKKYVDESELEGKYRNYGFAYHTQHLYDNPNFTLFFLQKDLHEGKIMNLVLLKAKINPESLLPRKVAESIPFSSKHLAEIFEKFSVKDGSREAENIKTTLSECEEPGIEGEEKYCATSLESMIDFAVSKLGKNIQVIETDAHEQTQKQKYTISRADKINWDDEAMVCHKQNYPYAVFYCHAISKSEAFTISMVGENGGKIEVAVVCHKDTSDWDPKHDALQLLNVKPGDVPVCHFLPENHFLWVRK